MNMRTTSGDAAPAVAAMRSRPAAGLEPARVFKTLVVSVDGRLGIAVAGGRRGGSQGRRRCPRRPEGHDGRPADAERDDGCVLGRISPLGMRRR
jgi:Cys-tRNA(Pro)/Cys-tRNA(Cys) deacylase